MFGTMVDFSYLESLSVPERVEEINRLRELIHQYSPFKDEPVDSCAGY